MDLKSLQHFYYRESFQWQKSSHAPIFEEKLITMADLREFNTNDLLQLEIPPNQAKVILREVNSVCFDFVFQFISDLCPIFLYLWWISLFLRTKKKNENIQDPEAPVFQIYQFLWSQKLIKWRTESTNAKTSGWKGAAPNDAWSEKFYQTLFEEKNVFWGKFGSLSIIGDTFLPEAHTEHVCASFVPFWILQRRWLSFWDFGECFEDWTV